MSHKVTGLHSDNLRAHAGCPGARWPFWRRAILNAHDGALPALRSALSEIKRITADLCVILIMGRRGTAPARGDHAKFSIAASLYEGFEVDDIIEAYRSFGIYVACFDDELDFIAWHQEGGYESIPRRHKFVYTFAMHGTGPARRSFIPAYCARENIPTVNSDAYTCAIDRHKYHCNRLLDAFGILVPNSWSYETKTGWFQGRKPELGAHVIGKATYEDGSIGLTPATIGPYTPDLERAFAELSTALHQPITVQEFIAGDEIAVPVFALDGYHAPGPVLILSASGQRLAHEVISHDRKLTGDYTLAPPTSLQPETIQAATAAAIEIAATLGHRGFARIDFRIASDGRPFAIDTAADPHLTRTSSYAYLFERLGFTYPEMMLMLIATGARHIGLI